MQYICLFVFVIPIKFQLSKMSCTPIVPVRSQISTIYINVEKTDETNMYTNVFYSRH